jgi:hypothetical protein
MADGDNVADENAKQENILSLQQAILAPLDAIFMAQVHAARSFMNLVGQIGYPHLTKQDTLGGTPDNSSGTTSQENKTDLPYTADFKYTAPDPLNPGKTKDYVITIPQLALIPLNPLAIDSANFKLGFRFSGATPHQQTRPSEIKRLTTKGTANDDLEDAKTPPWALVQDPVDLNGTITSSPGDGQNPADTVINIEIKISKTAMPNALDKLLATLSAAVTIQEK